MTELDKFICDSAYLIGLDVHLLQI